MVYKEYILIDRQTVIDSYVHSTDSKELWRDLKTRSREIIMEPTIEIKKKHLGDLVDTLTKSIEKMERVNTLDRLNSNKSAATYLNLALFILDLHDLNSFMLMSTNITSSYIRNYQRIKEGVIL